MRETSHFDTSNFLMSNSGCASLLLVLLTLLIGCSRPASKEEIEEKKAAYAVDHYRQLLKDPASAIIDEISLADRSEKDEIELSIYTIRLRAKNSFGGYVSSRSHVFITYDKTSGYIESPPGTGLIDDSLADILLWSRSFVEAMRGDDPRRNIASAASIYYSSLNRISKDDYDRLLIMAEHAPSRKVSYVPSHFDNVPEGTNEYLAWDDNRVIEMLKMLNDWPSSGPSATIAQGIVDDSGDQVAEHEPDKEIVRAPNEYEKFVESQPRYSELSSASILYNGELYPIKEVIFSVGDRIFTGNGAQWYEAWLSCRHYGTKPNGKPFNVSVKFKYAIVGRPSLSEISVPEASAGLQSVVYESSDWVDPVVINPTASEQALYDPLFEAPNPNAKHPIRFGKPVGAAHTFSQAELHTKLEELTNEVRSSPIYQQLKNCLIKEGDSSVPIDEVGFTVNKTTELKNGIPVAKGWLVLRHKSSTYGKSVEITFEYEFSFHMQNGTFDPWWHRLNRVALNRGGEVVMVPVDESIQSQSEWDVLGFDRNMPFSIIIPELNDSFSFSKHPVRRKPSAPATEFGF